MIVKRKFKRISINAYAFKYRILKSFTIFSLIKIITDFGLTD